jgi:hypothetical protein
MTHGIYRQLDLPQRRAGSVLRAQAKRIHQHQQLAANFTQSSGRVQLRDEATGPVFNRPSPRGHCQHHHSTSNRAHADHKRGTLAVVRALEWSESFVYRLPRSECITGLCAHDPAIHLYVPDMYVTTHLPGPLSLSLSNTRPFPPLIINVDSHPPLINPRLS